MGYYSSIRKPTLDLENKCARDIFMRDIIPWGKYNYVFHVFYTLKSVGELQDSESKNFREIFLRKKRKK